MPTPPLNQLTIAALKQWIFENVQGPITPIPENLKTIPNKKGIYFWLMHPNGYKALRNFAPINPIEPRVEDEDGYQLVYLGTAGTGKNGGGHLHQRIEWHITQHHTVGTICHGTLSTFRAGIGSLISDDLILYPTSSTEDEVNDIFKKYFRVYWIEYDDGLLIDDHELVLITTIRPLLNIQLNPNIAIIGHPTNIYRQRRLEITTNTKNRLGYNAQFVNPKKRKIGGERIAPFQLDGIDYELRFPDTKPRIFRDGIEQDVNVIGTLTRVNTEYDFQIDLIDKKGKKLITNALASKVYTRLTMADGDDGMINNPPEISLAENFPSKLYGPTLIILNCSDKKKSGGNKIDELDFFDEQPSIIALRNAVNAAHPGVVINPQELLPAIERYDGHIFQRIGANNLNLINDIKELHKKGLLYIVIVTAKYGAIEFFKPIPKYDLEIGQVAGLFGTNVEEAMIQFIREKGIAEVFNFCSNNYTQAAFPNMQYVWREWRRPQGHNQQIVGDWIQSVIHSLL